MKEPDFCFHVDGTCNSCGINWDLPERSEIVETINAVIKVHTDAGKDPIEIKFFYNSGTKTKDDCIASLTKYVNFKYNNF